MATEKQQGSPPELQALDQLINDVGVALSTAEARVQRLATQAFVNRQRFDNGLRNFIKGRHGLDGAIVCLQKSGFQRDWHFGQARDGWFSRNRAAARAALIELPDALRELQQLNQKERDLKQGRHIHLSVRTNSEADRQTAVHTQGVRTFHGMKM